jgi:hypothetical protein
VSKVNPGQLFERFPELLYVAAWITAQQGKCPDFLMDLLDHEKKYLPDSSGGLLPFRLGRMLLNESKNPPGYWHRARSKESSYASIISCVLSFLGYKD